MPYYPPYYNYNCPPGYPSYQANYAVAPYQHYANPYANQYALPYYPKTTAYKVAFTKVDAPNGEDFSASASNTTLKFLDGSNVTVTGKASDYSIKVGLNENVALTGSLTLANTADLVTTPVALQTIASAGTVATTGAHVLVTAAGNITGVILGVGTADGQHLTILNTSAFTITLDTTDATSNVKNSSVQGSDTMIAGHAFHFIWYAAESLWYQVSTLS